MYHLMAFLIVLAIMVSAIAEDMVMTIALGFILIASAIERVAAKISGASERKD